MARRNRKDHRPINRAIRQDDLVWCRDTHWRVIRVGWTATGQRQLDVVGLTGIMRGREQVLVDEHEKGLKLLGEHQFRRCEKCDGTGWSSSGAMEGDS